MFYFFVFFFNDTATTEIYTLSLHDALPICNCWWIIDYNRQSLDGIVREGLFERIEKTFDAFGWHVVRVKYGALQRAALEEIGRAHV